MGFLPHAVAFAREGDGGDVVEKAAGSLCRTMAGAVIRRIAGWRGNDRIGWCGQRMTIIGVLSVRNMVPQKPRD